MLRNPWKYQIALKTNGGGRTGDLAAALEGADVLLAASTPDPNTIRPAHIERMADGPIVFALANPVPEIWPDVARAAGAAVVATGRTRLPEPGQQLPDLPRGVPRRPRCPGPLHPGRGRPRRRPRARASRRGPGPLHDPPPPDDGGDRGLPAVAAAVADAAVRLGIARLRHATTSSSRARALRMGRSARLVRALARSHLTAAMPRATPASRRRVA